MRFSILMILIVTASCLSCTPSYPPYQRLFTTPDYDWPRSITPVQKSGYGIGGSRLVSGSTWSPFLFRVLNDGSHSWAFTYDLAGNDEHFNSVQSMAWAPESLLGVGSADAAAGSLGSIDIYLLATLKNGQKQFAKRYGTPELEIGRHAHTMVHPNHGPITLGTGYIVHHQTTGDQDAIVFIANQFANLILSAVFHQPGNQKGGWVSPTQNGGFIVVGEADLAESCDNTSNAIYLLRLDGSLNVIWNHVFDINPVQGTSDDYPYGVFEDAQGAFVISGTSRIFVNNAYVHRPFLMRVKDDGEHLWTRSYEVAGYPSAETHSFVHTTTSTGDTVNTLVGRTQVPFEALVFQTNAKGDVLWSWTYPPSYNQSSTRGEYIVVNDTNRFAWTGRMFDALPPSTGYDVHVTEINNMGESQTTCEKEVDVLVFEEEVCLRKIQVTTTSPIQEMDVSPIVSPLTLKTEKCN